MAAAYVLKKSVDQFMFNLRGNNNETLLTSERYKSKEGAKNGIASCQTNSSIDARYDRRTSASGKPYFVLKAGNGEVIGTSELYSSNEARDKGIAAVKNVGPTAPIEDNA
jgi:hypothetical protein